MGGNVDYEKLYWKEVEENIKLTEEIEKLKWQIKMLESKVRRSEIVHNMTSRRY